MKMVFVSGWGQSAKPGECFQEFFSSTKLIAPEQLNSWDAEGLSALVDEVEPVVLVGWSAGGMLAIDYSLNYPERVSALVLLSSSARFTSTEGYEFEGEALGVELSELRLLKKQLLRDRELALGGFQKRVESENTELDEYIFGISEQSLQQGLEFLESFDVRKSLGQITCPTLILCGLKDKVISPKDSMYLASKISGSRLKIFPEGRHSLFGGQVVKELKSFLEDEIT